MSGTDAQSAIEKEYEEAEMTACGYLLAASVLELDEVSMPQFREHQTRMIENLLLKDGIAAVDLPDDPDARKACMLANRLVHGDNDPEILDTLLSNASKPTYEIVLEALKRRMLAMGADIPDRLRMWVPERNTEVKRWRRNPTRNHRIGMVVEAMVMGTATLERWQNGDKKQVQLQRELDQLKIDIAAVGQDTGKPQKDRPDDYLIKRLNGMRARPWRTRNGGKGLTDRDLVGLMILQRVLEPAGIDGIRPQFIVRKHFPNLYATRNDATMPEGFAYSICDAVAEVLKKPNKPLPYKTVFRAWMTYRNLR